MSMPMPTVALAKPIVHPSHAGRRAPARRVGPCVRARASSGPQWSTDKTLYGEEKIDLKEGERLQCVRTPTWISVSASTAAVLRDPIRDRVCLERHPDAETQPRSASRSRSFQEAKSSPTHRAAVVP